MAPSPAFFAAILTISVFSLGNVLAQQHDTAEKSKSGLSVFFDGMYAVSKRPTENDFSSVSVRKNNTPGGSLGLLYSGKGSQNFAVEVAYLALRPFKLTGIKKSGEKLEVDASVVGVSLSLIFQPYAGNGPYAKVGVMRSKDIGHEKIDGVPNKEINVTRTGFVVGLGYQRPLSDSVSVRAGASYVSRLSSDPSRSAYFANIGLQYNF